MNVIREIERINQRELQLGSSSGSWHDDFKDSAWIFVGGLNFKLNEGDLLCVFSQYGEIEDLNLVRDKDTGKSKGFAFLKYEDARSTVLAVDNFNGITLAGRIIRVDHCKNYRDKEARDEDDFEYKRRLEMENEMKRRALNAPIDYSNDQLDETQDIRKRKKSSDLDPYLAEKMKKDDEQRKLNEIEDIKKEIANSLGIDDEDPMRDYLIDKELRKRRKEERKGNRRL